MLDETQKSAVMARVRGLEQGTGVQVATAIVGRADTYPEIAWSAFALAAALAGLAVVAVDRLRPDWAGSDAVLITVMSVLAAGAVSALAAMLVPAWARLFLRGVHRDAQVRRYAHALFLDHRLTATRAHNAVLLLVACFERKVELVADSAFDGRVGPGDWQAVVDATTAALAEGDAGAALLAALDRLQGVLHGRGFIPAATGNGNDLPDAPLELAAS